jgi:Glycosyl hydrolases family 15
VLEANGLHLGDLTVALESPSNEAVRAAVESGLAATVFSASVAVVAMLERSLSRGRPLDRSGQTIARYLEGFDLRPSGGIVAAATTSLPEQLGGVRNLDYRYCWLRDATFTLQAFMHLGYYDEARAWRDWIMRAVAGSPDQIQIMYGVGGERWLPELIVPRPPSYENSSPVRIESALAAKGFRQRASSRARVPARATERRTARRLRYPG